MAIVTHTFIDKCNTIIEKCPYNTGLNPIIELNYGKTITRALIHFDVAKLQNLINDKVYPDISKLKHVLKMTNSGSFSPEMAHCALMSYEGKFNKRRASSFNLIFFLIPYDWDEGRGFDYAKEAHGEHIRSLTTMASNWFYYQTFHEWDYDGIYSSDKLSLEFDKFTDTNENTTSDIIIGYQHFDFGNENIEFDITDTVNKFITGEIENHGIGIAFSPAYEFMRGGKLNYVGFFSNHTQGFFEPYVETTYDDYIKDDRLHFQLDNNNKLYFYSIVNNEYVNLDDVPTCTIDGVSMEVEQTTKGIYCTEVNLSSDDYETDQIVNDIWGNITYNGKTLKDVELEFVTLQSESIFGLPVKEYESTRIVPNIYGIKNDERIKSGDIRKVNVELRIPYTSCQIKEAAEAEYRLYVKSGNRQIDVINWQNIEQEFNNAYFMVNTNELVPTRYFVDIRITYNNELIHYDNILQFDIVKELNSSLY